MCAFACGPSQTRATTVRGPAEFMIVSASESAQKGTRVRPVPLVIDLERALLRCDLALETVFRLFRVAPLRALRLLAQLIGKRAEVVRHLEQSQGLEVSHLPYDAGIIRLIESERAKGRQIVLVSQHYRRYAQQVAEHLQMFDRVLAPGDLGSEPVEHAAPANARHPLIVWAEALRLHQWAKNLLLFVPLLAAHQLNQPQSLMNVVIGFLLFGLCASSVYLLNDFVDVRSDRQHPAKRFRPFAAGEISAQAVLTVAGVFLSVAFAGAGYLLPPSFIVALGTYFVITLAYSAYLKRIVMVDVVLLALLYTVRIIAGACAFGGELTFWLLGFSLFIFTSLALAKRYGELLDARALGEIDRPRGRGYHTSDLEMIASLGSASGYLAVMVLALYIHDQSTTALYRHPQLIWLACPLLLFWISRTWMLTHRGQMHQDPIVFALSDRVSLVTGVLFGLIFFFAAK
jgi:4-hydroxybenzoate polyprenyltransferase